MAKTPFSIIGNHLMAISAKVNGRDVRFLLDTGIGPTVLSKDFAKELSLEQVGTMSGKRMSGQRMEIPLVKVTSMEVAGLAREDYDVGVFDTSGFPHVLSEIKGIASIGFFKGKVLTIDYAGSSLSVTDSGINGLQFGRGLKVPIEIELNGPSVELFIRAELPGGRLVKLEVDTGSDILILNSRLMDELGVVPGEEGVETISGTDETGHNYTRHFAELKGKVQLEGCPEILQENPKVIFQDIIYDGLIGHDFLKRYTISYDISNSLVTFYRS